MAPLPATTAAAAPLASRKYPLAAAWGSKSSESGLRLSLAGSAQRLPVRPAGNEAWHAVPSVAIEQLADQAAGERGAAWPQPLLSHYARYFRDGNRTDYEDLVAERQQRLTRAVVLAALPESTLAEVEGGSTSTSSEWLDEVIDGAYLLCEQSSWSWAAHDDVFSRSGDVVPERSRPFVDLGAGEVAAQLAWLDLVLGERLDERVPGLRKRLRSEILERVIKPFLVRLDWHWLGLDGDVHNWNPWIHSNILVTAICLVDDPAIQARTVARCIEGLDRFLASIPEDGAIDEGFAYWWNGAGRALEGLALLEDATGGILDVDLPVIRELIAFPHRMHLGHNWFVNVADGPARAAQGLPWDMLYRWAVRLGDKVAAQHAAAFISEQPKASAGLGRVLQALLGGKVRTGSEEPELPPLVRFTYLPSVQIMVARQAAGTTEGLTLAAKGGHNGEHHNHRDLGSVVVAVDSVPLLVDAGQPTYTAKTFGPGRYEIRAMQSAWHSVPAPFGLEQGTGREFAATVRQAPTPDEPTLELGLGAAYGLGHAEQWIRTSRLNPETGSVLIDDRWNLPAPPEVGNADVDITYLVAGTLSVGEGTATVRPAGIPGVDGGRGASLRWKPATAVVLVDEWPLDDPLLSAVWGARLTRLRFRMPIESRASGAFTLTVEATNEY